MKLTRVTFTELHEVEGAFGNEWVAPAGGGFPKHLIYSYDINAKTVVFPLGWILQENGGTNEDNWKRTHYDFKFYDFCHTVLKYEYVKKVDFVEIAEYDPKEFQPDKGLAVMTLMIPRRNKSRTDKIIQEFRIAKTIVAERGRESSMVLYGKIRKKRTFPRYLYEFIVKKSEWSCFAKRIHGESLIPKTQRFGMLVDEAPVFPRQWVGFKITVR